GNLLGAEIPELAGQAVEYASGGTVPSPAVSIPLGFGMPAGIRELENLGARRGARRALEKFNTSGELDGAMAGGAALKKGGPSQTRANQQMATDAAREGRVGKQIDIAQLDEIRAAGLQSARDTHEAEMTAALAERDQVASTLGPHGSIQNAVPEAQAHMTKWW